MSELKLNYKRYINYCLENNIKKIITFIKDEKTILEVKSYLNEQSLDIDLIGVTFPANEKMYRLDKDEELEEFVPDAADGNRVKEILRENGITLVTSALPFEGIVIPGDNFNPYNIVEQTLSIIDTALPNLVQTLLIATDNGVVLPGERVLVMNVALAIDALGTNTRLLFHPREGIKIKKIIQE
ncbi:hypothetical protein CD798_09840 [Bacillaceae bacterium SAOS 7]|nr:hypothetical protein CD798_09840 [Bacillaceae bacterium SAOS 7]